MYVNGANISNLFLFDVGLHLLKSGIWLVWNNWIWRTLSSDSIDTNETSLPNYQSSDLQILGKNKLGIYWLIKKC